MIPAIVAVVAFLFGALLGAVVTACIMLEP